MKNIKKIQAFIVIEIIFLQLLMPIFNYVVEAEDLVQIKFEDQNLYNEIIKAKELEGKIAEQEPTTKTIKMTQTNIESVTNLNLFEANDDAQKEIKDITGIEHFNNLINLDMSYNNIKDISLLQNLTKLEYLGLASNQIEEITSLQNLTNLNRLILNSNNIKDISPLQKLIKLTDLQLNNNQIENITPVQSLINLWSLDLGVNQIEEITSLQNLTNLSRLSLSENNIKDISPLQELVKLVNLELNSNQIENITSLQNLSSLKGLELFSNKIKDITPLKDLNKLTMLTLQNNQIEDISPIADKSITYVSFNNQKLERLINLNNNIVELPPIFIQAKTKGNIAYTDQAFVLVNCKLNSDNKSVTVDEGVDTAKVTIKGGKLADSSLTITIDDGQPPQLSVSYTPALTEKTEGTVTATITANENIQQTEGWTLGADGKTLTKVYAKNTKEEVSVLDLAGNESKINVEVTNIIDTEVPQVDINYSTTKPTNQNVTVTLTADEEINPVTGWTLGTDGKTLTKVFTDNGEETVTISDVAGNEITIPVKVNNIDKDAPVLEITYSTKEKTNENVDVTIKANEEIQKVEGWIINSDRNTLTKTYETNTDEEIEIYDMAGNKATAKIKIENIDKTQTAPEPQGGQGTGSSTEKQGGQAKDYTTSTKILPKAGTKTIITAIILITAIGIVLYKKIHELKDVK